MAILKKVKVEILVDGNIATEYENTGSNHNRSKECVKYIEAVSDATFEVKMCCVEGYKIEGDSLTFYVYVDGEYAAGQIGWAVQDREPTCIKGWKKKKPSGSYVLLPFKFAALNVGMCKKDVRSVSSAAANRRS